MKEVQLFHFAKQHAFLCVELLEQIQGTIRQKARTPALRFNVRFGLVADSREERCGVPWAMFQVAASFQQLRGIY